MPSCNGTCGFPHQDASPRIPCIQTHQVIHLWSPRTQWRLFPLTECPFFQFSSLPPSFLFPFLLSLTPSFSCSPLPPYFPSLLWDRFLLICKTHLEFPFLKSLWILLNLPYYYMHHCLACITLTLKGICPLPYILNPLRGNMFFVLYVLCSLVSLLYSSLLILQ
jgi:hypothetical protein